MTMVTATEREGMRDYRQRRRRRRRRSKRVRVRVRERLRVRGNESETVYFETLCFLLRNFLSV